MLFGGLFIEKQVPLEKKSEKSRFLTAPHQLALFIFDCSACAEIELIEDKEDLANRANAMQFCRLKADCARFCNLGVIFHVWLE